MKFRLSLLAAAALLLLIVPITRAENCSATLIDQTGSIHNPQVITSASATLINQGADVHVVIVDSIQRYGTDLAGVERYFESSCPSWLNSDGHRKDNLFVVMVAPNDRAKNMFLGSYYNGAFDIPSTYSTLSNQYFKNRQWEMGLAAVLSGTTGQAVSYHQRTFSAQQQRRVMPTAPRYVPVNAQSSSSSGVPGVLIFFLIFLLVIGIIAVLYFIFRERCRRRGSHAVGSNPYVNTAVSVYWVVDIARAYAPQTTVINNTDSGNGLLTGVLLGEAMSRPNYPNTVYVEPSAPTYVEPAAPSYVEPASAPDAPDSTWVDNSQQQADTDFGGGGDNSGGGGGFDGGGSGDSNF